MLTYRSNIHFSAFSPGVPVVFLHAFPVNQKMWEPQFAFLREKKTPFLSFDYPGFGRSSIIAHKMSIFDYGLQAVDLLRQFGIERAIFVGLSMGGYVALNLFRKHPEIFAGLVLADTRASADSDQTRSSRYQTIRQLQKEPDLTSIIDFHLSKFFTPVTTGEKPGLVKRVAEMMCETSITGIIQALEAMAKRPDSEPLLAQMKFPVKIITGEKDRLTTVQDAQRMLSLLPNGSLTVVSEAAHLSNLEQPQQLNTALWELISAVK